MNIPQSQIVLNAVTATTVSRPIVVGNAERVTLSFKRTDHVSGSAIFSVQASIDGSDYIPNVNLISNDPNNHSQTIERQITVQLEANGHQLYALDLENFIYDKIQVKVIENGSGKSTVKLIKSC